MPMPPNYLDILVGNLSASTSEQDLKSAFKDYNVRHLKIHQNGMRMFGLLQLDSQCNVQGAVKKMNGFSLKGRSITVRAANSKLQAHTVKSIQEENAKCAFFPDKGPPPLEAVYEPYSSEEDMPPRLEAVYVKDSSGEDMPPKLEAVYLKASNPTLSQTDTCPRTLLVADFPEGTTEEELYDLFEQYYPLQITVILNRRLKRSPKEKTYAYVTVPDKKLATQAIFELDDTMFHNRKLLVTYMLERVVRR